MTSSDQPRRRGRPPAGTTRLDCQIPAELRRRLDARLPDGWKPKDGRLSRLVAAALALGLDQLDQLDERGSE